MLLWIAMALMTGVAVLAVLVPLARRARATAPVGDDIAVYRDQLAEVERDQERGLIASDDAAAARAEVGRRLLAAADRTRSGPPVGSRTGLRRAAAVGATVVIPLVALGSYLVVGSPALPDMPLAARLSAPPETGNVRQLIARAEGELARNPENGAGWDLMAPIYMRIGRYADAARAYANAIRLVGSTADRETMHGIALVAEAGGVVTAQARAAFDRALALDPKHVQARISRALAFEQDGERAKAVAELKAVLAEAPPDAPWTPGLRRELARLETPPAAGPSAEDVRAAEAMAPDQRQQMVRGMVEGLAARLASGEGSVEEWLRLVRSYQVLGETEKARQAVAQARERFGTDAEARARIDALAQSLGIGG